jgi:hypothetical protein
MFMVTWEENDLLKRIRVTVPERGTKKFIKDG